jgi:hypothetical protein
MARSINPKCWECALLSSDVAQQLHGETGDGCWEPKTCHRRRSHYRHRADNNQKRKGEYAVAKAATQPDRPPAPPTATVDKPNIPPVALLYLYRDNRRDAHLHAIAIAVWQGDRKLEQSLEPTHCMGMTNSEVNAYLLKALGELRDRYGIVKFKQEIRYDPSFCPIRPCPLHP